MGEFTCMAEDPPSHRDPALRAEIERRVGRNVLLYQAIEHAITALLTSAVVESTDDGLDAAALTSRSEWAHKLTLGTVVGEAFKQVLTANPAELETPSEDELRVRSRFSIELPDDHLESLQRRIALVVEERNDLAHHFLQRWRDRRSDEDSRAALAELDDRHQRAEALHTEIVGLLRSSLAARQEAAEYLASARGQLEMDFLLLEMGLVQRLVERAASGKWTSLGRAGSWLSSTVPVEAGIYRRCYGNEWLQHLLAAHESVFEWRQAPTPSAGAAEIDRWQYRLRTTDG
jgi:hypothetical protein